MPCVKRRAVFACLLAAWTWLPARGAEVGVVSHVKVVSDKVEDVSSLAAWKASFIRKGMTDQQKAMAIFNSVVKFRHQDLPPSESLQADQGFVQDPIKTFNVYGYGMCSCASSNVVALARSIGFQGRGWGINRHSVPEVSYDGKTWHMLDTSLINYFPKKDGSPAGVEEIVAGVQEWFRTHPDLRGNDAKLVEFMRNNGWRKGPAILSRCPTYDDNGWLPAATHGWYSTVQEYDCKPFVYEYGYSQGYQVNVQLRKGEILLRNWSNKGLHVNMNGGTTPGCLTERVGKDQLRYSPRYGDLAPGRIGNGTLSYEVPLVDGSFRDSALEARNLQVRAKSARGPAISVKDKDAEGVLVLRMPSSYVYLSGQLTLDAVPGAAGKVVVSLSDNNGLAWKELATVTRSGVQKIDLKPFIFRRYDYRVKVVLHGAGTGLNALRITHDVQHSQRALPALDKGRNTITFSAGPAEGTITIEGATNLALKGKQLIYTDFNPTVEGMQHNPLRITGATGQLTFPVVTPGDLVRLRFGGHYRARDIKDGWDLGVSFDEGKTFKKVDRLAGPTAGSSHYTSFSDIPKGSRKALVRFKGSQRNTTCLFDLRIDADYREPHGGFRPVRVTYRWEENGQAKEDVRVLRKERETYVIHCAAKPVMKSIRMELADSEPAAALPNWPHWRGPNVNGSVAQGNPPIEWDAKTNIQWKAKLPGKGSSTPIVWGNKVFVLTAVDTGLKAAAYDLPSAPDPRYKKKTSAPNTWHRFLVLCFDLKSGKELWRKVAAERVPHEGHHPTHCYAAGSPATDGKRLIVSFGSFGLYAYDLDGKLLWSRDLGRMATRLGWGEASTPALWKDKVVVNWDHEAGSFITVLSAETGKTVWKVDRDELSTWATPVVVEHKGAAQILVPGTNKSRSYDLATGKVIWECGGFTVNCIPTPVVHTDRAILMSGYRGAMAKAIPLGSKGDVTDNPAWQHDRATPYVPSPVLAGNRLYFTSVNEPMLTCLDARTGKVLLDRVRLGGLRQLYASPVVAAGRLYIVDRDGTTIVLKHGELLRILATNKLGEEIDASPVVVCDRLLLRGAKHLYCIAE